MSFLLLNLEDLFKGLLFRDTHTLRDASPKRKHLNAVDRDRARDPDEADASFRKAIHLIDENVPSSFGL